MNKLIKKLVQYLLQGTLLVAPILVTFYVIYYIITSVDRLVPIFTYTDPLGQTHVRNWGLGFLLVVASLITIGYFSSFFIKGRIASIINNLLEKTPGIGYIYSLTRDFVDAFAGEKKKFEKPVLVSLDAPDVYRIGFITNSALNDFDLVDYVSVYVPMSFSVAGTVHMVPKNRVKKLEHISGAQAMKYAISGGVVELPTEEEDKLSKKRNQLPVTNSETHTA